MLIKGLLLLFVGLKLAGFINWSWFIVLLPGFYLFICFIFNIVLKEALKENIPWAIRFVRWVKAK